MSRSLDKKPSFLTYRSLPSLSAQMPSSSLPNTGLGWDQCGLQLHYTPEGHTGNHVSECLCNSWITFDSVSCNSTWMVLNCTNVTWWSDTTVCAKHSGVLPTCHQLGSSLFTMCKISPLEKASPASLQGIRLSVSGLYLKWGLKYTLKQKVVF